MRGLGSNLSYGLHFSKRLLDGGEAGSLVERRNQVLYHSMLPEMGWWMLEDGCNALMEAGGVHYQGVWRVEGKMPWSEPLRILGMGIQSGRDRLQPHPPIEGGSWSCWLVHRMQ